MADEYTLVRSTDDKFKLLKVNGVNVNLGVKRKFFTYKSNNGYYYCIDKLTGVDIFNMKSLKKKDLIDKIKQLDLSLVDKDNPILNERETIFKELLRERV